MKTLGEQALTVGTMVRGDRSDMRVLRDASTVIALPGARHRVLAGYGFSTREYREAFGFKDWQP